MNKNNGPFLAFDTLWFQKHQTVLVFLLNNFFTKRLFRYLLRIHKDCPEEQIVEIGPTYYKFGPYVKDGVVHLKADLRTHPKFAKRIYYSLRPLWWALHCWDLLIADRFFPRLSFGFSSLVIYPVSGVSADAYIRETTQETWASKIAKTIGISVVDNAILSNVITTGTNGSLPYTDLRKISAGFLTSTISGVINSAVISFNYSNKFSSGSAVPACNIYSSSPASDTAIVVGDYDGFGSTEFSTTKAYADIGAGYNDWTLNASGLVHINQSGVTHFGCLEANYAVTGTDPLMSASSLTVGFQFYGSNQTGTSQDPKLTVDYTPSFIPQIIVIC